MSSCKVRTFLFFFVFFWENLSLFRYDKEFFDAIINGNVKSFVIANEFDVIVAIITATVKPKSQSEVSPFEVFFFIINFKKKGKSRCFEFCFIRRKNACLYFNLVCTNQIQKKRYKVVFFFHIPKTPFQVLVSLCLFIFFFFDNFYFDLAKRLLEELIDNVKVNPTCKAVYLHVLATNTPAIQFYEKSNFLQLQLLQVKFLSILSDSHILFFSNRITTWLKVDSVMLIFMLCI